MNIYSTSKLSPIHFFISRLSDFSSGLRQVLSSVPFLTMTSTGEIPILVERLSKAEKRLKILVCEINDIKSKINAIQQQPAAPPSSPPPTAPNDSFSFYINVRQNQQNRASTYCSVSSGAGPSTSKRAKRDFPMDGDYAVVYTDGACENNGQFGAKAGIGVWFSDAHPLNVSKPVNGRATNNTAEIQACNEAIKIALQNGIRKLCIKTDSQFVINAMTQWIRRWKVNSWKVATGGDVKNKEDFVILDQNIQKLDDVKWVHVNGHSGIKGNEEADKLARLGAAMYVAKI